MKTWKQKYFEIEPLTRNAWLKSVDAARDMALALAPRWWQVLGFNLAIAGALAQAYDDGWIDGRYWRDPTRY